MFAVTMFAIVFCIYGKNV